MSNNNKKLDLKAGEKEAVKTFSKEVHVLIDADSLVYRACHLGEKAQKEVEITEDHPLWKEGLLLPLHEEQQSIFDSMVQSILHNMEYDLNSEGKTITAHSLLFTPKAGYCEANGMKLNFRYNLIDEYNATLPSEEGTHPGYKASRKGMTLPSGITEMYEWAMLKDNLVVYSEVEADDAIVMLKKSNPELYVIACIDKDIYEGCEGTHWNYNRNEWAITTQEEAELFYMRQCMTGDSSDGIKGIFRFGPKAAEKALPEWMPMAEMWEVVIDTFTEKGYSEEYALLMYRLVSLNQLRENGDLVLWSPSELENDTQ